MKPSGQMKKYLRLFAILVTVGLTAWILYIQDWSIFWQVVTSRMGILLLLASILVMLVSQVFAAGRWVLLLRVENPQFTLYEATRLTFIGSFSSLFLPTSAGGDVVRVMVVKDRPRSSGLASVVADRAISILSMLILIPFAAWSFWPLVFPGNGFQAGIMGSGIIPSGWDWLRKARDFFSRTVKALWDWRRYPGRIAGALLLAWGSFACGWLSVWLLAMAIGIQVTYGQIVAAGVWIYLIGLLPISVNGIGLQEAGYVYLYGLLGIEPSASAALGLLSRIVYVLTVLPGGIWLWVGSGRHMVGQTGDSHEAEN